MHLILHSHIQTVLMSANDHTEKTYIVEIMNQGFVREQVVCCGSRVDKGCLRSATVQPCVSAW